MSYILEALKKAQAERQLGNAPTLSAVPVGAPPPAARAASRLPLIALGAALAAALVVGAGWWWLRPSAPTPAAGSAAVVLPASAGLASPAVVTVPVAPAPITPTPVAPPLQVSPPSHPVRAETPATVLALKTPAAPKPAAVSSARPANAEEEHLPSLRELPENVRAAIPQLSFGGYMYSPNPADRLVLIDKVLRHEGEEVAPGLVLEKLLPKAALMNYRGTRYKVAY